MANGFVKPKPDHCSWCDVPNPGDDHWKWEKDSRYRHGGKWRCAERKRHHGRIYTARRRADPERRAADEEDRKAYYFENPEYLRYKAYKYADHNKGFGDDVIPWSEAQPIMLSPCLYCGIERAGGLDRVDNSIGHVSGNVVAACATCNLILLDMPLVLKQELSTVLSSARRKGLLDLWKHPRMRG